MSSHFSAKKIWLRWQGKSKRMRHSCYMDEFVTEDLLSGEKEMI